MGIDFSHCDAHWSYFGFNHFRIRVANEIDIDLDSMEGFGGSGSWDDIKDPLKYFLNHSDCDGTITAKRCGKIATRLEEVISKWGDNDYDKKQAERLIAGMRLATQRGEELIFQ